MSQGDSDVDVDVDDFDVDLDLGLDADDTQQAQEEPQGSLAQELVLSPVLQTLLLMTVGWLGIWWTGFHPASPWTVAAPLDYQPFTIITSIYAHASVGHLVGNAIVVAIFGWLVARKSSLIRFHLFFIATGSLSGIAQIGIHQARPISEPSTLVGASGAALGLMGYAIAGNTVSDAVARWGHLSRTVGVIFVAAVSVSIMMRFSGPNIANIAHGTGAAIGLVAGRLHLLRARSANE
jgi:membrane associated rhomboid family serine protease